MNAAAFVSRVVDRLVFGLVHAQLYAPEHARVREAAEEVVRLLGEQAGAGGPSSVVIGVVDGRVVFDGRPMLGATLFAKRLLAKVAERGSGGIELSFSAQARDVIGFIGALSRRGEPPRDAHEANKELHALGVVGVRFLLSGSTVAATERDLRGAEDATELVNLHQGTVDLLQGVTISVCQGREFELGAVTSVVDAIVDGLQRDGGRVHSLARYPEHDFFTFGHSIRVALLALDVARSTSSDPDLLRRIGTAALLHDVGKALISWDVLHKRGALTPDERREMQRHPVLGAGVLVANRESDPLAVAAAYGHHRTVDGQGYPRTCDAYHQSHVTRLVKICDVFEALTASRPYKAAISPARAYRVMLDMPGHFDPDLLRHFVHCIGVYPAGTRVRLDDGCIARVLQQRPDPYRPLVEIQETSDGPVDAGARRPYDLSAPESGGPTLAVAALPAVDGTLALA